MTVDGKDQYITPAKIEKLPVGDLQILLEKEGYVSEMRSVSVVESRTMELPTIALKKNQGKLELVSEPKGAEYKILKASPENPKEIVELVEVGRTPALLEEVEAGEYEVRMAVKGWPDYSQRIKVLHNRSTSVSAVFASGGVNIVSDPVGAEVWSASGSSPLTKQGFTPLTLAELSPGRHRVEVRYRDWTPIRRTVEVKGSVTQNLEFTWERSMVAFSSDPPGGRGLSR